MSNSIAKFQVTHGVINNAPANILVLATHPVLSQRVFSGTGAPSATTLNAGNGRFCAGASGFVLAASIGNPGTAYSVGDVLPVTGGTFTTACVITVDAVTSTGAILDWHVSTAGNYSVYPANPVSVTGGTGSGATFNLGLQPPDAYLDVTTPTAPVPYVCMTAGSNATSVWAKTGGSSSSSTTFADFYTSASTYLAGSIVQVLTATTIGSGANAVTIQPGTYVLRQGLTTVGGTPGVTAGVTTNMIPQYPYPVTPDTNGVTIYWMCISLGISVANVCASGSQQIYINASGSF
jgi:hypothetical protein